MKNNTWLMDLLILTCLIGAFFLIFLGNRPLNVPDEGRYAEIPREMVVSGDYVTPHLNGIKYFEKPPLFYWMQAGAMKAWGLSEWIVRLPNMLLGLFGCLMIYGGARLLYDRQTGLCASIMLATSLLYYAMSHLLTLDMIVTVCLTGSLLSFIVGLQHRKFFLGIYFFSALAVLSKGLIGILLPGFVIFVWILLFNQWRLLKDIYLPSGLCIFLVIAAPWHILVQMRNPEFFHFYFIEQHFERYLTMSAGRYQPVWFFLPIVLLGLFPWIIFLWRALVSVFPRSWQACKAHKKEVFLLLWAGLIFVFFSLSKSKLIPYILPVFPALAIIVGRYISTVISQPDSKQNHNCFRLLPFIAILIAIAFVTLPRYQTVPDVEVANYYLRIMAVILISGSILTYIIYRRYSFRAGLIALIISSMLFFLSLMLTVPKVDTRTVKPLAQILLPILKPTDEVATYGTYYQDFPFYLRRHVTIVRWLNELTFGLKHQPEAQQWMINPETFWKRWEDSNRMFMLTQKDYFAEIDKKPEWKFYILGETKGNLLISNQP